MVTVGDQAPAFTLPNQDGEPISLGSLKGKPVVLDFDPDADTPGCITQACGVRDASAQYAERGVSPDPVAKVKKFHDEHSLDFTLLADPDHAVCEQFGTWVEKSMYGRRFGVRAAVDLHPRRGRGRRPHHPKAKPETHDEEILAALRKRDAAA